MARKVQAVDTIPSPSSSDNETEDQNGSNSSSGTDDEQNAPHPQKPQEQEDDSDSDDETEDDEAELEPVVNKPSLQDPHEHEEDSDSDDETEDDEAELEPVVKKPSLQEPQEHKEDSDSDDETNDDEAELQPVVKKPSLQEPQESNSDSDDTHNPPSASAFTVKPIVPKAPTSSKTTRVKSRVKRPAGSEEIESGKVAGGNSKRPAETEVEKIDKLKKNKKSKVSVGDDQSVGKVEKGSKGKKAVSGDKEAGDIEEKKSPIKWSEKDEIALLGGIIDYKEETGDDWNSKMDAFYEFVTDLISVSLAKNQLSEKVKRLKKKFQTNAEKCQSGEEPVFSRPHDSKLFELSQKIWVTEENDSKVKSRKKKDKKDGIVVGNTSTPQEEVKNTIIEVRKEETQDFWSLYPRLCASLESEASGFSTAWAGDIKDYVKVIISGIGKEKAIELEDGWKAVFVMEHQLYARRVHLISEQAEAVLNLLG